MCVPWSVRKSIPVLIVHSTRDLSHLLLGQAADEAVHTGTAGSRAPRQHVTHYTNGCCPPLTTQMNHAKLFVCWFWRGSLTSLKTCQLSMPSAITVYKPRTASYLAKLDEKLIHWGFHMVDSCLTRSYIYRQLRTTNIHTC